MINQGLSDDLVIIITTEVNFTIAEELAKELLNRKLAACVSLRDVKSYYWWEQKLEKANEVELLIKTKRDQLQNLYEVIPQLHSYQTPEIICLNTSTNANYFEWLEEVLPPSS